MQAISLRFVLLSVSLILAKEVESKGYSYDKPAIKFEEERPPATKVQADETAIPATPQQDELITEPPDDHKNAPRITNIAPMVGSNDQQQDPYPYYPGPSGFQQGPFVSGPAGSFGGLPVTQQQLGFQGAYPPGQYNPQALGYGGQGGAFPVGGFPPTGLNQGAFPPTGFQGGFPQGGLQQGGFPPGALPQGGFLTGGFPSGASPQGGFLPGGLTSGAFPQGGFLQGGFPPGMFPQSGPFPQGGFTQGTPGAYSSLIGGPGFPQSGGGFISPGGGFPPGVGFRQPDINTDNGPRMVTESARAADSRTYLYVKPKSIT